jgi:hypothetical protein
VSTPGEYDDKDMTPERAERAGSRPAQAGEYDDKDVADDTERPDAEPGGSFVDKDVGPSSAAERRDGEYDDKDVNGRPPAT